MKRIIFVLFVIFNLNGYGQNIVPNPSFEQYNICPNSWYQISYCQFWSSYYETPDYYNTCSTNANFSPPSCFPGFQYPHSGAAFIGLITFVNYTQNGREFVGSSLILPLVINQKYFLSFYVNLSGENGTIIASNKIGVKFSTVPYSYSNPAPINNFAHFYTDSIITDTVKWTKISGSFIADSAYNYIMIGNFFNDSLTDTLNLATTNNNYAYYYIDDVCVTTDSLFNENWTGISEQTINKSENITIYPNPANNYITITTENNEAIKQITLSDLTGRVVFKKNFENEIFETITDLIFLPASTYFISISTTNNIYNKKIVVVK